VEEKHRATLRTRLEKLSTKEAVDAETADFKGLLAQFEARGKVGNGNGGQGTGKTEQQPVDEGADDGDDETTKALKEHQRRMARLPKK
jgi:hypothetical protein